MGTGNREWGRRNSGIRSPSCLPIAPGGFEPPFSDPKSDVLPLDEGADVLARELTKLFQHFDLNNSRAEPGADHGKVQSEVRVGWCSIVKNPENAGPGTRQ